MILRNKTDEKFMKKFPASVQINQQEEWTYLQSKVTKDTIWTPQFDLK